MGQRLPDAVSAGSSVLREIVYETLTAGASADNQQGNGKSQNFS